jgi:hypothetical protein
MEHLQLNLCNINHQALEALAPGLKANNSLHVLDLSYNSIPDECGTVLAKIVQE